MRRANGCLNLTQTQVLYKIGFRRTSWIKSYI
uniref:Uncharacterized protein n=1 Tax=Arundo donax TaxID=35708 RepID=A0A0A8Y9P9_ARUDO